MKRTAGRAYGHLNLEMKTQLLELILNIGLDQIPLDPNCRAAVEGREVQGTGKKLLREGKASSCSSYGISIFHSKYCQSKCEWKSFLACT